MDKNHDWFSRVVDFLGAGPSMVLCPHPFSKCSFLETLARTADHGVIYVDFDMLYSGYVAANMLQQPANVLIRRPEAVSWREEITGLIQTVSVEPYLVIIDSLNGMNAMWAGRDTARLANYAIMLLASLGTEAGTKVVVSAIAREGSDGWELLPGGRQLSGGAGENLFVLEVSSGSLQIRKDGEMGDPLDLGRVAS